MLSEVWEKSFFFQKILAIQGHYGVPIKKLDATYNFPTFLAQINEIRVSRGKVAINKELCSQSLTAIFLDL
jgi:hypothetical protein